MFFDISGSLSFEFGRKRPVDPIESELMAQIERAEPDDDEDDDTPDPKPIIGFRRNEESA